MIDLEKMSETFKWVGASLAVIALGAGAYHYGYTSASDKYEKLIAEKEKADSDALTKALEASKAKEREDAEKISQALAERDKALSDAATLRSAAVRVRTQSDTVSKNLKRAGDADTASSDRYRKRLGQCEKLLGESAGLLGDGVELSAEGAGLSAKLSGDKDTLTADR